MDVSIIIVNYKTRELLKNCLDSIFRNTKDILFEVIVSDNNSDDGSMEMVKNTFKEVIFIENKRNLGFGAANNVAARLAKGKYIFYLNSDTLLINNAVKIFYDYFEKVGKINRIGALGCNLLNNGSYVHSAGCFPSYKKLYKEFFGQFLSIYAENIYKKLKKSKENSKIIVGGVDYITGADLFIKNDSNCFFDERYFMYYEEVDLQYNLYNKGLQRVLINGPKIVHLEGGSINSQHKKLYFTSLKSIYSWLSALKFMKKNKYNFILYNVLKKLILFTWNLPSVKKITRDYRKELLVL